MSRQLRTMLCLVLSIGVMIALGGCPTETAKGTASGDQQLQASKDDTSAQDVVSGKAVYTLDLGYEHRLEFYEMSGGFGAVRETLPITGEHQVLDGLSAKQITLADVYRLANPTAQKIPQEILDVDTRVAAAPPISRGETPKVTFSDNLAPDESKSALPIQEITAAATCTGDLLHDNWGAQWFLNNFCVGGSNGWCQTNRTSGWVEPDNVHWFKWSVMAADFAVGGHIKAAYMDVIGCPLFCYFYWQTAIDENVPSRTVTTWAMTAPGGGTTNYQGWASGDPACQRLHYAARWTP